MGDNELNGTPEGVTPDGASEQNAASQLQDQQNAGQYGQQTNQQYAGPVSYTHLTLPTIA